eukprot:scaffold6961_cov145-Isochrysis_galbana.AAC.2
MRCAPRAARHASFGLVGSRPTVPLWCGGLWRPPRARTRHVPPRATNAAGRSGVACGDSKVIVVVRVVVVAGTQMPIARVPPSGQGPLATARGGRLASCGCGMRSGREVDRE